MVLLERGGRECRPAVTRAQQADPSGSYCYNSCSKCKAQSIQCYWTTCDDTVTPTGIGTDADGFIPGSTTRSSRSSASTPPASARFALTARPPAAARRRRAPPPPPGRYAAGESNGGMMTYQLGVTLGDRLAIAPQFGSFAQGFAAPKSAVPVLDLHGSNDTVPANCCRGQRVLLHAGRGDLPRRQVPGGWMKANGCDGKTSLWPTKFDGQKQFWCIKLCSSGNVVRRVEGRPQLALRRRGVQRRPRHRLLSGGPRRAGRARRTPPPHRRPGARWRRRRRRRRAAAAGLGRRRRGADAHRGHPLRRPRLGLPRRRGCDRGGRRPRVRAEDWRQGRRRRRAADARVRARRGGAVGQRLPDRRGPGRDGGQEEQAARLFGQDSAKAPGGYANGAFHCLLVCPWRRPTPSATTRRTSTAGKSRCARGELRKMDLGVCTMPSTHERRLRRHA